MVDFNELADDLVKMRNRIAAALEDVDDELPQCREFYEFNESTTSLEELLRGIAEGEWDAVPL